MSSLFFREAGGSETTPSAVDVRLLEARGVNDVLLETCWRHFQTSAWMWRLAFSCLSTHLHIRTRTDQEGRSWKRRCSLRLCCFLNRLVWGSACALGFHIYLFICVFIYLHNAAVQISGSPRQPLQKGCANPNGSSTALNFIKQHQRTVTSLKLNERKSDCSQRGQENVISSGSKFQLLKACMVN